MDAPAADEALMCRYRDGDAGAFETLYQRHRGGLFRFILRQCGEQAVAEELFQDVWMRVIKARSNYEVKASFTTWLYQVARNRVIDHYRRRSLRLVDDADTDSGGAAEPLAPACEQPDRRAEATQGIDRLLALVMQLPPDQREAFLLREEAGMSIEEIADCTGVATETAKSRLRYAVNKLRAGLSEYHE
jgi:RNA polymerase sigma-70 factor (ECF subfamily)